MEPDSRWEGLKKARPIRVLGVYVAVSWVVLQGVGTLSDVIALPEWVGPVTLVLLGVGLVIVGATAWIQSLASTTAAEDRGEVPSDWEIAPGDAVASLMAGRVPHLTWGRVLLGGIVALSLVIGGSGAYVLLFSDGRDRGFSPVTVAATPSGLAVLPFTVANAELDQYREGMVSLVSTNIDGVESFRSISPRSVIATWQEAFGDVANVRIESALGVARELGARYALVGDVASAGESLRLTAELYDLETGEPFPVGSSEGRIEDILELIDQMSVNALRTLLARRGSEADTEIQRLSGLLTSSIAALDAYLEGDARFRRGELEPAIEAYERAAAADSSFALAWYRLAQARSWLPGVAPGAVRAAQDQALSLVERLPNRDATLLRGLADITRLVWSGANVRALREHVQRYPDDPGGWNLLAEYLWHLPPTPRPGEIEQGFARAVELDPGFQTYYAHLLPHLGLRGDRERFDRYLGLAREAGLTLTVRHHEALWAFIHGTPEERAAAEELFRTDATAARRAGDALNSPYLSLEDGLFVIDVLRRHSGEAPAQDLVSLRVSRGAHIGDAEGDAAESLAGKVAAYTALFTGLPPAPSGQEISADSVSSLIDVILQDEDRPSDAPPALSGDSIVREALLRIVEGDGQRALDVLRGVPEGQPITRDVSLLWPVATGQALAVSGDLEGAIQTFEGLGAVGWWPSFYFLRLGELYEATGDSGKARESYDAFLSLYGEADEGGAALLQRGRDGLERVTR